MIGSIFVNLGFAFLSFGAVLYVYKEKFPAWVFYFNLFAMSFNLSIAIYKSLQIWG